MPPEEVVDRNVWTSVNACLYEVKYTQNLLHSRLNSSQSQLFHQSAKNWRSAKRVISAKAPQMYSNITRNTSRNVTITTQRRISEHGPRSACLHYRITYMETASG